MLIRPLSWTLGLSIMRIKTETTGELNSLIQDWFRKTILFISTWALLQLILLALELLQLLLKILATAVLQLRPTTQFSGVQLPTIYMLSVPLVITHKLAVMPSTHTKLPVSLPLKTTGPYQLKTMTLRIVSARDQQTIWMIKHTHAQNWVAISSVFWAPVIQPRIWSSKHPLQMLLPVLLSTKTDVGFRLALPMRTRMLGPSMWPVLRLRWKLVPLPVHQQP